MTPEAQTIIHNHIIDHGCSKQDAVHTLYSELEKGIQSIKNGKVYTIEDAWEEIDNI